MARNFSKLLDEISSIPDADGVIRPLNRGTAGKKVVRPTSTKSMTVHEVIAKAGPDADKVQPFTGKKPAKTAPGERAEPREHTALRVARAIGEMKRFAQGKNLNGPVTEEQLKACHALARAGEMSQDEVADVEKALNDKRCLPTYLLRKLSNA